MPERAHLRRILCVASDPTIFQQLHHAFGGSRFAILTAITPDQAVAACAAQVVAAAVIHADSIRGQEWSVAQSLKLVNSSLPIILLDDRKDARPELAQSIDTFISPGATDELLSTLERLIARSTGDEHSVAGQAS